MAWEESVGRGMVNGQPWDWEVTALPCRVLDISSSLGSLAPLLEECVTTLVRGHHAVMCLVLE